MKAIRTGMIRDRIQDVINCETLEVEVKKQIILILEKNINHIYMI